MTEGTVSHCTTSFMRALVPTMRLQFKNLITFLKVPTPTTVTLEIKFPCVVGGGEIGINN